MCTRAYLVSLLVSAEWQMPVGLGSEQNCAKNKPLKVYDSKRRKVMVNIPQEKAVE